MYKGKMYYFPCGSGKSDREAYAAALEAWEAKKREADGAVVRTHQLEYEAEIETWEQVLVWSRKHSDAGMADRAVMAIERLTRRSSASRIKPLDQLDRFDSQFKLPSIPIDDNLLAPPTEETLAEMAETLSKRPPMSLDLETRERYMLELDGSPQRIAKEVWRDRLEVQNHEAVPHEKSVAYFTDLYVAEKTNAAEAGEFSVGRIYKTKLHLQDFRDWIGSATDVAEITSPRLIEYKQRLLDEVIKETWSKETARDRLGTIRAFVRWLWRTEVIESLPRVLDPKAKDLMVTKTRKKPVTFTNEELATLLGSAQARTKLYILLMLNCGMTQKDISDLEAHELDWDEGRIVRKRSKTRDHENVPEVSYKLWPETLELLTHEWSGDDTGRVLLNRDGFPLWSERYEDDKYKKTDNIRNAFARLTKKTGVNKPLISLKKTSASRLRNNDKFNSVRSLFLGHAEVRVADQHYAENPKELLDRALEWLRGELGIDQLQLKK